MGGGKICVISYNDAKMFLSQTDLSKESQDILLKGFRFGKSIQKKNLLREQARNKIKDLLCGKIPSGTYKVHVKYGEIKVI